MDLNLDFDIAPKIVSISENKDDNLGFIKDDIQNMSFNDKNDTITPNLNVSDGVELLSNNFGIKEEPKKEVKKEPQKEVKKEDKRRSSQKRVSRVNRGKRVSRVSRVSRANRAKANRVSRAKGVSRVNRVNRGGGSLKKEKKGRKVSVSTARKLGKRETHKMQKKIKEIQNKSTNDMINELKKEGIEVSGKSKTILKDIYMYQKMCGINIKRE